MTVSLKFGYNIFLFEKTFDLCDLTAENGLKCPLKPDMVSLAFKTFVPTAFPPVSNMIQDVNKFIPSSLL